MSKLLILDANVIIVAFRDGFWKALALRYQLVIPSVIVEESQYYTDSNRSQTQIDLKAEIAAKRLEVVETCPEELALLYRRFKSDFIDSTDPGELHALGYLYSRRDQGIRFCTGDTPAIKAAAIMGLTETMVSLEVLMRECGLAGKIRTLGPHFKADTLQRKLGEGLQQRHLYERV